MLAILMRPENDTPRGRGRAGAIGILGAIASLSAAVPVMAHHGTAVTYDHSKSITLEGTVTQWDFIFPHPSIYFDVIGADGKVEHWGTETGVNPANFAKDGRQGVNRKSIKAGDKILITCAPNRHPGTKSCLAREVTINGTLVAGLSSGLARGQNAPAAAPADPR